MKTQKLNHRQAHWTLYLSRFDFILKHVPEIKMEKVNGLSRRPDWKVVVDRDNDNQVLIKDNWICSLSKVVIKEPDIVILEKIKNSKDKDKEIVRVIKQMKKAKVKMLRENKWQIKGDLVLKEEKIYVPRDKKLRVEIIWLHYDMPVARHGGR